MRRVLTPGWLARHLALVTVLVAFALLGRWQWDVSRSATGTVQNTIYAFQWWLFGATAVYCWWWLVRHELRAAATDDAAPPPATTVTLDDEDWIPSTLRRHRLLPPPEDATDAELLAFKRYLAELHAADHSRS